MFSVPMQYVTRLYFDHFSKQSWRNKNDWF